jgi:choline dehydrogenase
LYPQNREGRLRISTNLAYLGPARSRSNLTIRADATVDRIVLDDGSAVGVEIDGELVTSGEVILCAGAPLSSVVLLRSGIGPTGELLDGGVEARVDLPGVGKGLIDQPGAAIPFVAVAGAGADDGPTFQIVARLAGFPGHDRDDAFYLSLVSDLVVEGSRFAAQVDSSHATFLMVGDMACCSRGSVRLGGPDSSQPPIVDLGFYSAEGDLDRMVAGLRAAWEVSQQASFSANVERFALVDDDLVGNEDAMRRLVGQITNSRLSVMGGCRMGPAGDPSAVVDAHCRVYGVDNLRVVDASIVPVALRTVPALTCVMLGERVVPWILAGE